MMTLLHGLVFLGLTAGCIYAVLFAESFLTRNK
jgi:hypothetical protein